MRLWKKYWGILPIGIVAVLQICISIACELTDSSLRNIPQIIMLWLAMTAVLVFIYWICSLSFRQDGAKKANRNRQVRGVFLIFYSFLICGAIIFGIVASVFKYRPEHVVKRNGIRMVASVHSFLQEKVYYYEYKNVLFHGAEQIGWEDYGNGGGDPLERGGREPNRWYFEDLDGNVIERGEK